MTEDNYHEHMDEHGRQLTPTTEDIDQKKNAQLEKKSFPTRELRRSIKDQKAGTERTASNKPIAYRRNLPQRYSTPTSQPLERDLTPPLDTPPLNGVPIDCARGPLLLINTQAADVQNSPHLYKAFSGAVDKGNSLLYRRIAAACHTELPELADLLFMDIETTGLSNSPLFLIGIMRWETGGFKLSQYLARNYAEEAAVISSFIEACERKTLLITFNGKTFDVPYIRARAAATGISCEINLPHFDLLHEARRIWKDVLPDCRLQTLERHICNRPRKDDVPGEIIPEVYHEYVRSGNTALMTKVLRHNRLDLITMADLMTRFPEQ